MNHWHHCPVRGCRHELPRHILMCKRHWRLVSPATQRKVWDAWRNYRSGGGREADVYLAVRAEAIREANDKAAPQPTLF